MLAYVFWHSRGPEEPESGYAEALTAFQGALVADPPPGFLGCAAYATPGVPWLGGEVYEDWYAVDGWGALGTLNEAAVDARRALSHDAVAGAATGGAGAVYLLRGGQPGLGSAGSAAWLDKPRGEPYAGFRRDMLALVAGGGGLWERQMVLGPAPEFCLLGAAEAALPDGAVVVERRPLFAGGPAATG